MQDLQKVPKTTKKAKLISALRWKLRALNLLYWTMFHVCVQSLQLQSWNRYKLDLSDSPFKCVMHYHISTLSTLFNAVIRLIPAATYIIARMSLPHPFLNFLLVSFKMLKNLSLSPQKHTVTHARILNITVRISHEGLMKNNESVQCWKNEVLNLFNSSTIYILCPNAFALNKGKPHVQSHHPFWFFASFVDLIF